MTPSLSSRAPQPLQSSQRLAALYALSQAILGPHTVRETITTALAHLQGLVPWHNAGVVSVDFELGQATLYQDEQPRAEPLVEQTLPLAQFQNLDKLREAGPLQQQLAAQLSRACPQEARLREAGLASFLVLPLCSDDEFLGLIRLARTTPEPFTPAEVEVVQEVGNLLAVAMLQARLQERLRQNALELELQVAERTALLQQQHDFLNAVLNTSPALIIVHDSQGHILHFNTAAAAFSDHRDQGLPRRPVWEALHQDVELTGETVTALSAGRFPANHRSRVRTNQGSERLIEWSSSRLPAPSGPEQFIVSVGLDVTSRAQAIQAYETLVEHSLQGLIILQDNRVVFANDTFCQQFGRSREQIYQMTQEDHLDPVYPADREQLTAALHSRAPVSPLEFRILRGDGHLRWLRAELFKAEYAGRPALHATVMDVTEAREAEAIQQESEALNQAVIDSLPLHVAVLNQKGKIVMVNAAWKRFSLENENRYLACTGVETHDLEVCRCATGKDDTTAHAVLGGVRAVVEGRRQRFSHEYTCHLTGGPRYFLMEVTPLAHRQKGVVVSHLDITNRCHAEEQLRLLNRRLRLLTQQVVSAQEEERHRLSRDLHDQVGQALSVLKYNLELLRADLPLGPGLPFRPESAHSHMSLALTLCEETLAHIRAVAHDLRPAALDDLGLNMALEAFCHDFAGRSGLQVTYEGLDIAPVPNGADICLYRFLQEALTNVLRHAQANQIAVELARNENFLEMTVTDNGQGLAPGSSPDGTAKEGVGLLGMEERLQAVGGRLQIWSEPGRGTRLTAEVPASYDLEFKKAFNGEQEDPYE